MLRNGRIPVVLHESLEPVVGVFLIAAAFLLGYDDDGAATAVSIVVGIGVLVVALSTDWRVSVIKAIPLPVHFVVDLAVGVLLVAAPFLFGFTDDTAPLAVCLVVGVADIVFALGTRFDPADEGRRASRSRGRRARPAG